MAKLDLQLVHVASGEILARTLEKPRTFIGRGIGLMFRRALADGHGMVIDPCNGIHMLFMRFPIDAVFLDSRERVRKVYRRLPRWWGVVWFVWGARSVLELPSGSTAEMELQRGDQILIS